MKSNLRKGDNDWLMTPDDLANRWGISTSTLLSWRIKNKGPSYLKLGKSVLYRLIEVEKYERANTVETAEE